MTGPSLLTIQEVAALLKLNAITIYNYIRLHKLQAIKFGRKYRVEMNSLTKFIQSHRTK
jgi:excisionase family DNA binding protein